MLIHIASWTLAISRGANGIYTGKIIPSMAATEQASRANRYHKGTQQLTD